ncbi:hypothetical protein R1flu_001318 [Riccia fluitans]|uniref:t-SNARE coiled-coil homology domain-containing protein n=1 Tax=Riccia fluitans TaxID=41844 RepID=A0ABD1Y2X9_9MARC
MYHGSIYPHLKRHIIKLLSEISSGYLHRSIVPRVCHEQGFLPFSRLGCSMQGYLNKLARVCVRSVDLGVCHGDQHVGLCRLLQISLQVPISVTRGAEVKADEIVLNGRQEGCLEQAPDRSSILVSQQTWPMEEPTTSSSSTVSLQSQNRAFVQVGTKVDNVAVQVDAVGNKVDDLKSYIHKEFQELRSQFHKFNTGLREVQPVMTSMRKERNIARLQPCTSLAVEVASLVLSCLWLDFLSAGEEGKVRGGQKEAFRRRQGRNGRPDGARAAHA